jgi:hypothetical protein
MRQQIVHMAEIWLLLLTATGACSAKQFRQSTMSEAAIIQLSAEQYSAILIRVCRNGWRYPRTQIEQGFKRHLSELRVQLIEDGYLIVPDEKSTSGLTLRVLQNNKARGYGCGAPYWIYESE